MKNPVIIFSAKGLSHLIYCVWAVRSLRAFSYDSIEIIVSDEGERDFLKKHLGEITCTVIPADSGRYNMWAFRVFALEKYKIIHADRDVVVCDTDILWKNDPVPLLERFLGKPWVHKITALNPADLDMIDPLPRRIGLRTMLSYKKAAGLSVYLNFHLNAGLFMLSRELFSAVVSDWAKKVRMIPPNEMIMTEALLSLSYAEKGLVPVCDRENIKLFGITEDPVAYPVVRFEAVDPSPGMLTGYQTATHYHGNQRWKLVRDAAAMGLDRDYLRFTALRELAVKKIKNAPLWLKRIRSRVSGKTEKK